MQRPVDEAVASHAPRRAGIDRSPSLRDDQTLDLERLHIVVMRPSRTGMPGGRSAAGSRVVSRGGQPGDVGGEVSISAGPRSTEGKGRISRPTPLA